MSTSAAGLARLIAGELSVLTEDSVKLAVLNGLVDPRPITLDWEYGTPDQQFEGWVVFDHEAQSDTLIVYCEHGFGPLSPWGLVFATPRQGSRSMGMDSGWFRSFMEAFWDSHAATLLAESGQAESR
ncbi:hypothetical protein [Brevundimonas vesicularis]|uniref:Uncharacterized protein n=1 Tax=Brevundimonas vesicularis TaxID=41276 RepID=A0A1Z3UA47_BREVE|nr:hypothetical protein [Brevundimonas vesicularis]ASE40148.1 hypothetical protein CEP68_11880 [Brevundimonas vesicularis]MDX2334153.1 hypothetical protein [Brevundimonas vesicularis]